MLIPSSKLNWLHCSFLFTGLALLTACGESVKSRITPHGDTVYLFESENEASKVAKSWEVICDDVNQCPNTVGQLIMKVGSEISVCTATLIGTETAITNSHCFDFTNQSLSLNDICDSGAAIVFASNSTLGRETVECQSVVVKSDIKDQTTTGAGFLNPDFMILKLKRPVLRGFEKFDFSGMQETMKLRLPKVNPQGAGLGLLVTDTCEVLYGTYLLPSADDKFAPVHVLKGCHVIGGNSGSALFDSNGLIRGLIFATLVLEKLDEPESPVSPEIADVIRRVKPSFATNAACVSHLEGHKEPARCSKGRTDKENELKLQNSEQNLMASMTRDLLSFKSNDLFGYDVRQSFQAKKGETVLVYRPVCLRRGYENSQYVSSPVLKWTVALGFTEQLKFSFNIKSESAVCSFRVHSVGRYQAIVYADQELCQAANDGFSVPGESWTACP